MGTGKVGTGYGVLIERLHILVHTVDIRLARPVPVESCLRTGALILTTHMRVLLHHSVLHFENGSAWRGRARRTSSENFLGRLQRKGALTNISDIDEVFRCLGPRIVLHIDDAPHAVYIVPILPVPVETRSWTIPLLLTSHSMRVLCNTAIRHLEYRSAGLSR